MYADKRGCMCLKPFFKRLKVNIIILFKQHCPKLQAEILQNIDGYIMIDRNLDERQVNNPQGDGKVHRHTNTQSTHIWLPEECLTKQ